MTILGIPILSLLIFFPILGAIVLIFINKENGRVLRWVTLIFSLVEFIFSLPLFFNFDSKTAAMQFVEDWWWIQSYGISYKLGIDGISLLLVLLTTFLTILCILCSWTAITFRVKEFMISFLFLETGMIGALVALYFFNQKTTGVSTFDVLELYKLGLPVGTQYLLFGAFALAFAIKVPMFPFHTWLPDAHTEAPTAGSVILAGVLLKMGTYGFIRFAIPLFPKAAFDLMLNHGISTGSLFLIVGMLYERRHTRLIADFGGLSKVMPVYAVFFMIVTLSSIGLPGTNGFVGEFLILLGAFRSNVVYGVLAATGVVLGAAYMLWMFQRVMFGKITRPENEKLKDLNAREITILVPMVIMIFLMGIYPKLFFSKMDASVEKFISDFKGRVEMKAG